MNNWIKFVKDYQHKHNCSYKEALIKSKNIYKKGGGIGFSKPKVKPRYTDEDEINIIKYLRKKQLEDELNEENDREKRKKKLEFMESRIGQFRPKPKPIIEDIFSPDELNLIRERSMKKKRDLLNK